MTSLFDAVPFSHGPAMKNRFMLSPLTNQQSHDDGTLSDEEYRWLTMRAAGGFGLTMTCASHVIANGQGFSGQLGCFDDSHLDGLTRLATAINAQQSVSVVQLHHAGRRSPQNLIGHEPLSSGDDEKMGARAMTTSEVEEVIEAFISAAVRVEKAGFHGVELHGAHDYLICQFLNAELNTRKDQFGGSLENRARMMFAIIDGIRTRCGDQFHVGVRLSPERFGMSTSEIIEVFGRLVDVGVDMIDMSLWDVFKTGADAGYEDKRLIDIFANLERGSTRLAVAGKLYNAGDMQRAIDAGADIVAVGRAAITNHDFPLQTQKNKDFAMRDLPVPASVLNDEGLSPAFVGYMKNWQGFVAD
ncbi:MAG: dehydrogenase [Actinomycetota bacterium]|jgi:2,4-dienoyl-CoA reductase-like NADH-dependent reductase (Old Yellow Enzyme family)